MHSSFAKGSYLDMKNSHVEPYADALAASQRAGCYGAPKIYNVFGNWNSAASQSSTSTMLN
jgi:hypothetical protein